MVSSTTNNNPSGTPSNSSNLLHLPNTTTLSSHNKRINVDSIMLQFQKVLGQKWDAYRDVVTHFLLGKLTRMELQTELDTILVDPLMIQMHNQFLLANLTNAMREPPPGEAGFMLGSWSRKSKDAMRLVRGDTQLAKLKHDILSLPIRERKRIKAIAKDTSKRPVIPSAIMTTRQSILPKIPFVNTNQTQLQQAAAAAAATGGPVSPAGAKQAGSQQQQTPQTQQIGATAARGATPPTSSGAGANTKTSGAGNNGPPPPPVANPAVWAQDIVHGYEAPLASETYEIPDADSLRARMLGISLEHGLLRGVDTASTEIMQVGLEMYLKSLVEQMYLRVQGRRCSTPPKPDAASVTQNDSTSSNNILKHHNHNLQQQQQLLPSQQANLTTPQQLSIQDVDFLVENAPHCLVELPGPIYRLKNVMLENDDMQEKLAPAQPHIGAPEAVKFLNELLAD